jgi:hypothetical protein
METFRMPLTSTIFFGLCTGVFFLRLVWPELTSRSDFSQQPRAKLLRFRRISAALTLGSIVLLGPGEPPHPKKPISLPLNTALDESLQPSQSQLTVSQLKHLCSNLGIYAVGCARYRAGDERYSDTMKLGNARYLHHRFSL